jgi:hypothetical protein
MAGNDDKEVKISYKKSKDFTYIPATGAFGGPNPQGEIICNFFVEYRDPPEESKIILDTKTGKVKKEISGEKMEPSIRELQIGIIMRPDIARSVGEWLTKEADKIIFKVPEESSKT